jgi:hypothetical protein
MNKPRDPDVPSNGEHDYDLAERAVGQLRESELIVTRALVVSSLPEALKSGEPEDDLTSLDFTLVLLTDGRRGFLVLVDECDEFDAPAEMTELLTLAVGGDFVVRGATMSRVEPVLREHTLDLRHPAGVRARLEAAYEHAFGAAGPIDHAAFFARLVSAGAFLADEREIRVGMRELADAMAACLGH